MILDNPPHHEKGNESGFMEIQYELFPYNICSFAPARHEAQMPLVFRSLLFPMHFINQSTWKSTQHYIITSVSAIDEYAHYVPHILYMLVAPNCVCLSTTATYLSGCSFMWSCVPYYCHVCLVYCVSCGSEDGIQ